MAVLPTVLEEGIPDSYNLDLEKWKSKEKPHGISAMIRLRNDTEFVSWAIDSHREWCDEFILVTQPSDDNTVELAEALAEQNGDVSHIHYPYVVEWVTPRVGEMPNNSIYSPAHMTNWGLNHCNYSWIAKVEGDVIALPTFAMIRDRVDLMPNEQKYYGRVGFNLAGSNYDLFSKTNPRNAGWDEAVFPNHPRFHCIGSQIWETMNMSDYPNLRENMGWSFMHMKRCKAAAKPGSEEWVEFTRSNVEEALKAYAQNRGPYPGPPEPTTEVLFEWRERYGSYGK